MLTQKILAKKQAEPMPSTKINAFLKEFPWVQQYASGGISEVYVSQVEPSLLSYRPLKKWQDDPGGGCMVRCEYLYLVDESGKLITREAQIEEISRKYIFFGPKVSRTRTEIVAIGEVYLDMDDTIPTLEDKAVSICFVVSYVGETERVIVYRVPKNCSLPEWIEAETKREQESLRKQCDGIDVGGASARKQ
jgi:hypothetical protein